MEELFLTPEQTTLNFLIIYFNNYNYEIQNRPVRLNPQR